MTVTAVQLSWSLSKVVSRTYVVSSEVHPEGPYTQNFSPSINLIFWKSEGREEEILFMNWPGPEDTMLISRIIK